jgi:hypothetical protein
MFGLRTLPVKSAVCAKSSVILVVARFVGALCCAGRAVIFEGGSACEGDQWEEGEGEVYCWWWRKVLSEFGFWRVGVE